ncbi:MAG TPA: hypothetical protein VNJ07_05050 [Chitinophagales bacterium]|nr:hypothetical protein [Chitinophagales bacterium]
MKRENKKVLLIFNLVEYPTRITLKEHLLSFKKYSGHSVYYLNFFFSRKTLRWLLNSVEFDLVIFHHSFTNHWYEFLFRRDLNFLKKLHFKNAVKAAFFQDEYHHSDWKCRLINELGIEYVFSVANESEFKNIYNGVNHQKVKFIQVLTGYIDEEQITKVQRLEKKVTRTVDIGYRAFGQAPFKLGRFGMLKKEIGDRFNQAAPQRGLKTDISTRENRFLEGDQWYEFLLRCKYVLGVESGASLLDRSGEISNRIDNYVLSSKTLPSFEEVEANCFPGMDGNLNLKTISPRHFEACLTKTCQILMEGDYSGLLKPDVHYIPLKKDFSNLEEVLAKVKEDRHRENIVENCRRDILLSGKYTYKAFAEQVFSSINFPANSKGASRKDIWMLRVTQLIFYADLATAFVFKKVISPVYNTTVATAGRERINKVLSKFFGLGRR